MPEVALALELRPESLRNQRLFDLVRYQRMELLTAGLITESEFDELAKEHSAVQRLEDYDQLRVRLNEAEKALNTPELHDFVRGVVSEAQHQRLRWGSDHDAGKEPEAWFWLLGYLAGKALAAHKSGNHEKALHHTISSAAALANWHASILGNTGMRPGIDPAEHALASTESGQ